MKLDVYKEKKEMSGRQDIKDGFDKLMDAAVDTLAEENDGGEEGGRRSEQGPGQRTVVTHEQPNVPA